MDPVGFIGLSMGLTTESKMLLDNSAFGNAIKAKQFLINHITTVIEKKRTAPEKTGAKAKLKDCMENLCASAIEDGAPIPTDKLAEMSLQFILGAHDTTSSFLAAFIVSVCQRPDVLAKIRKEQDQIWGAYAGETCDEFHIDSHNVLKQVPFMDRCVLETERVFPPAPGNFRGAKEDFEYEGVSIKAGSSIFYDAIATNHDPYVYGDDAHEWKPSRWEEEGISRKRLFSRVSFGAGFRNCPGQGFAKLNMKVFLTQLFRLYDVELLPDQDLKCMYQPSLKFRSGVSVRFEKRKM